MNDSKIRYSLKYLWLLMILPLAFVFSACGQLDEQATVNKSGNYQTAQTSALTQALGEQTTIDQTNGYRLTAKVKTDNKDLVINVIIKNGELAAKIAGTADGKNQAAYAYFTQGKLYIESEGRKVYLSYPTGFDVDQLLALFTGIASATATVSINDYVVSVNGTTNILEKAGNNFRIVMEAGKTLYLNFDNNNKLVAMQASYQSDALTTEITLSGFSGNIDFPNLNVFKSESISLFNFE